MTEPPVTPSFAGTLIVSVTWIAAFEIAMQSFPAWPSAVTIATLAAIGMFYLLRVRGGEAPLRVVPTFGAVAASVAIAFAGYAYPIMNKVALALIVVATAWIFVRHARAKPSDPPARGSN